MTMEHPARMGLSGRSAANGGAVGMDKGAPDFGGVQATPAPATLPPDLGDWLAAVSSTVAGPILGISEGRVRQLKCGGTAPSKAVLDRWAAHQRAQGWRSTVWQVRRVDAFGLVWLSGSSYDVPATLAMPGQSVNVAPLPGGRLLVCPIVPSGGMSLHAREESV